MAGGTPEEYEEWHNALFSPASGMDPDHVTQEVIDDEMSLFHRINGQNMG